MKWPTLDSGEMRHQITILGQVPATDISGSTVAMVPLVTCYAKIEPVRGIDVIRSGQETTQLFLIISIWWRISPESSVGHFIAFLYPTCFSVPCESIVVTPNGSSRVGSKFFSNGSLPVNQSLISRFIPTLMVLPSACQNTEPLAKPLV